MSISSFQERVTMAVFDAALKASKGSDCRASFDNGEAVEAMAQAMALFVSSEAEILADDGGVAALEIEALADRIDARLKRMAELTRIGALKAARRPRPILRIVE